MNEKISDFTKWRSTLFNLYNINTIYFAGITPKIANEVGLYVDTTVATGDKNPRVAMHNAKGTKIHRHKTSKERRNMGDKALIAFPNDRAKSVRPSDRRENYT